MESTYFLLDHKQGVIKFFAHHNPVSLHYMFRSKEVGFNEINQAFSLYNQYEHTLTQQPTMKVMKCTILVFLPYTWFVEPVINSREEDF